MTEWKSLALGDFIELKRGYDLPKQKREEGLVPVISSSGVTDFHSKAMRLGPGVVTGRYGTLGEVFYVEGSYWPLNTTLYVTDFKGNDPLFIYYFLKTLDLQQFSDKAAVPGLNRNHLHMLAVSVPDNVDDQKQIAKILRSFDDKIETNWRMAATLEEMARAVFRAWFVDFLPVRAKASARAEGRDPERAAMAALSGRDEEDLDALLPETLASLAATATLFPDAFGGADAKLGKIPEGWRAATIGDCCKRVSMGPFGSDITRSNFVSEGVPVVRGGNLSGPFVSGDFVYLTEEKADSLGKANARPFDIVITHRGTIGQVGMVPHIGGCSRYVVSQSQMVLEIDQTVASPYFVLEYLTSPEGQHWLLTNTSQVGVPAIARPTVSIKSIPVVLPSPGVQAAFDRLTSSLYAQRLNLSLESEKLAQCRDVLLPRLLSCDLLLAPKERGCA